MGCIYTVSDKSASVKASMIDGAKKVLKRAAFDTQARAQQNITAMNAIVTGAMKASVYASVPGAETYGQSISAALSRNPGAEMNPQVKGEDKTATTYSTVVSVGVKYASYVEVKKPFFQQAVDAIMPTVVDKLKTDLGARIK